MSDKGRNCRALNILLSSIPAKQDQKFTSQLCVRLQKKIQLGLKQIVPRKSTKQKNASRRLQRQSKLDLTDSYYGGSSIQGENMSLWSFVVNNNIRTPILLPKCACPKYMAPKRTGQIERLVRKDRPWHSRRKVLIRTCSGERPSVNFCAVMITFSTELAGKKQSHYYRHTQQYIIQITYLHEVIIPADPKVSSTVGKPINFFTVSISVGLSQTFCKYVVLTAANCVSFFFSNYYYFFFLQKLSSGVTQYIHLTWNS